MVHLLSGYVNSMNIDKYTTYGAIIASTGAGGEDALKVRSDKEVGARISGLLGERPQRELAEAIDMQPSVLSRALAGERAFNMSELVDIADYLGVHIEDLLFDEQPAFVKRGDADDVATLGAVDRCSRLIDGMLQIEAVGR
jgi:Helix-turn-helix